MNFYEFVITDIERAFGLRPGDFENLREDIQLRLFAYHEHLIRNLSIDGSSANHLTICPLSHNQSIEVLALLYGKKEPTIQRTSSLSVPKGFFTGL